MYSYTRKYGFDSVGAQVEDQRIQDGQGQQALVSSGIKKGEKRV